MLKAWQRVDLKLCKDMDKVEIPFTGEWSLTSFQSQYISLRQIEAYLGYPGQVFEGKDGENFIAI